MGRFGILCRSALAAAGAALLSGCFFQPGQFDATLHVMADGRFSFAYEGEIVMAGMEQLAEMANRAENAGAQAYCYDEDTFEERACTEAEIAEQARNACTDEETFEARPCTAAELAEQAQNKEREDAMMAAMFGGIDLSDPAAGAQLAATIQRQAGWEKVEYVEEGVFSVKFAISSRLGHDFQFPTLEGFPIANSFLAARLRDESRVRIEAAGFGGNPSGNPLMAMMMGIAAPALTPASPEELADAPAQIKHPTNGTFRLVTDARILTNNTDEGPSDSSDGQVLTWTIRPGTTITPNALLALEPQ